MIASEISEKSPPQGGLNFIEQLHALSSENCTKVGRPFLTGVSWIDLLVILTRPRCKMWDCPQCGARNAKKWIARIINHVNRVGGENWRFLTITAHEKWRGAERSLQNIRQGWKKLYNRILRRFPKVEYARVWEQHADGSFHCHVLMCAKISQKWLKDNARQCGMGYQANVRKVENAGQIAGYISKYMVKSGLTHAYPKGARRIEVSRNWTALQELRGDIIMDWYINDTRQGQIGYAQALQGKGFDIVDTVKDET